MFQRGMILSATKMLLRVRQRQDRFFPCFFHWRHFTCGLICTVVQCIIDCNIGDIRSNLLADAVDIILLAASRHVLLSLIDLLTDSAFDTNALKLMS